MSTLSLIPLAIACISVWVSLSHHGHWFDELPRLLAAVIATISSMWFFVMIPWPVKLSLILLTLIIGNFLVKKQLGLR
ncbi:MULTISPECIES: hypothetical protein [Arthrospira]|jgi:hypothetical protein|uniref:Uncharacterized protein n=1 Tax=Limnospira platensis NIES-46 TaxID=1236695 RepID=A0A5M3TC44_LIMPL|nr:MULTISPECIES: hypothetical protein [Arthrospira]AMW29891.1 hypothetical protein AP285_20090 [Arthrospira platensis YZ]KDR54276.1 hypothetical protein APPUASWS_029850 [Arthrospira platensis str. Paraca]MBD2669761.1 hypothetical protein [Arthrospira platensis FACHB-439]MBD2710489.1 hypothetical protein [Arthrospira platensis FACHB-835]MDF2212078.1 hypothetical protein [Arthrospira platensis NCB002]MDT9184183.1 hypothetical protein [Limnospira sp. PMC 289.06]MDT9296779.1 hypothetical protein